MFPSDDSWEGTRMDVVRFHDYVQGDSSSGELQGSNDKLFKLHVGPVRLTTQRSLYLGLPGAPNRCHSPNFVKIQVSNAMHSLNCIFAQ
jgi:hypothetical protein